MTDYEAVKKYFKEIVVQPGEAMLVCLDDNLNFVKSEKRTDLYEFADLIDQYKFQFENCIYIDRIRYNTFFYNGNDFEREISLIDGLTTHFGPNPKGPIDLNALKKDLADLKKGLITMDEETCKYPC